MKMNDLIQFLIPVQNVLKLITLCKIIQACICNWS